MKLIIEKHPESNRLTQFFKKIESIAKRNGIEVDELISDKEINTISMQLIPQRNILSITSKRNDVLLNDELPDDKFSDRIPMNKI